MHMSTNFPAISTVTGFYPGWCHNCCERAFCLSQTKNLLKCFHPALSCPLHPCMPFNYLSGFLSSIKLCPFVSSLQQVLVLPEICPSLLVISWCLWGLHFGRSSTLCRDFLTCCTVCSTAACREWVQEESKGKNRFFLFLTAHLTSYFQET